MKDTTVFTVIGYAIDFSFLIDMVLTFFTIEFDEKSFKWIETHRDIAKAYLKGWFLMDLVSIIPLDLIFKN